MEFLRAAIAAGGNPQIAASGATVLKQGRKFRQLVTSAGKLTPAGRLYEEETNTALDTNCGYWKIHKLRVDRSVSDCLEKRLQNKGITISSNQCMLQLY